MPSRARPSVISAAVMALPLSLKPARGRPRFWKAWQRPCAIDLGRLSQIPLQMAGKARVVVDDAEQDRRHPLAAHGQHLLRPVMAVRMPQAIDVLGLVASDFARNEPGLGPLGFLRAALRQAPALAEPVGAHEAGAPSL